MEGSSLDFRHAWNNSDQILIVEGCELHVHRCMLSLWSPVFERMFNSNFKEKESERVELKGKQLNEIETLLHVMYDRQTEITDENYDYLLELSEEYQMTQLRKQCIKHLNNANKTRTNAIKYLAASARFGIDHILDECVNELACVPHTVLEDEDKYVHLGEHVKYVIIAARVKRLERETADRNALMEYLTQYLYEKANENHVEFLREQGLEETVLNKCPNRDEHVNLRVGQNFDIDCPMCRKNVTVTKKFDVDVKTISRFMEKMYLLTTKDEKNGHSLKEDSDKKNKLLRNIKT